MKRDLDLIREIMLHVESNEKYMPWGITPNYWEYYTKINGDRFSKYTEAEINLALDLLATGDFTMSTSAIVSGTPSVVGLTWKGYEYLDKIRDPSRWEKVKRKLQPIGDFSYEAIKQAVTDIAGEQVKTFIPLAVYTGFIYLAGLFSKLFR